MAVILPEFARARVVVVGDLMLDRYWSGATSRISPEAPVPVVRVEAAEDRPGGAGNVALNVAALGGQATVIGATGEDEEAAAVERALGRPGITLRHVPVAGSRSITKLRIISRHQQLIRLDFEDGFRGFDSDRLLPLMQEALADAAVVVFSDYAKGTLARIEPLIAAARDAGKTVVVDPKGADFRRYAGASLLTPNLAELEAVVGPCPDEATLVRRGLRLIETLGVEALLVTRSEQGMSLLRRGDAPLHIPTNAREVFDVTGAGDTVIGVLAAALAAGAPLAEAAAAANLAAGVVVGKLGTASASVEELRASADRHAPLAAGVTDEALLRERVAESRAAGERIVLTNGCFDLLHAGHVAYLAQARRLGDRLIVAVNDDASVARLKGAERPVTPLPQRMAVLAGLAAVDWVVPFAEDTPERLICELRPDVLVKGGDYRPDQVAGAACVEAAGGEVVVLPYLDGVSTSGIIATIRRPAR